MISRPRPATPAILALTLFTLAPAVNAQDTQEAVVAFRAGKYDDAISMFTRAVRRAPGSAEAARGLVAALREIGRYDDAREVAERYAEQNPNSNELANSLGEVLYLHGAGGAFGDDDVRAAVGDGAGQMAADGFGQLVIFFLHAGGTGQTATAAVNIDDVKAGLSEQVDAC